VVSYQARAAELGLDRFSLELRVAALLLRFGHRADGLQILADLNRTRPGPQTCSDNLVYNFDGYFRELAEAAKGFRQTDSRLEFLLPFFLAVSSPSQISPAAALIADQPDAIRQSLAQDLAGAIKKMDSDPRLSVSTSPAAAQALVRLVAVCPACAAALGEYREYLQHSLEAGICAGNRSATYELGTLAKLNPLLTARGLQPLSLSVPVGKIIETREDPVSLWTDPAAQSLLMEWKQVRAAAVLGELDATALDNFEENAEHWSQPAATPDETFLVKALSLEAPAGVVTGRSGAECIARAVQFMDGSSQRRDNPGVWLVVMQDIAARAAKLPAALDSAMSDAASPEIHILLALRAARKVRSN
jgi:hypothetical protein